LKSEIIPDILSSFSRFALSKLFEQSTVILLSIRAYFILIVLFSTSFSKSVSKTRNNFLDQLKAPLFAEFDVSNVQNYIDTQIDTRLDHINDTLMHLILYSK
jgi:hypothetical protein